MVPSEPTLTVATANAPLPVGPGKFTTPPSEAARATMSATGPPDEVNSRVFTPTIVAAVAALLQVKPKTTSRELNVSVGVSAIT